MRIFKVILGVMSFVYGLLLLAVVVFGLFEEPRGIHLRGTGGFAIFEMVATYALCGAVLAVIGIFLIVKSKSRLPGRTRALFVGCIVAGVSISTGMARYAHTHRMTGAERIKQDLKLLDAAVDQQAAESDPRTQ